MSEMQPKQQEKQFEYDVIAARDRIEKAAGKKQKEIAADLGTDPATLNKKLNGTQYLTVNDLCKISRLYDVSVDYLLGLMEERTNRILEERIEEYEEDPSERLSTVCGAISDFGAYFDMPLDKNLSRHRGGHGLSVLAFDLKNTIPQFRKALTYYVENYLKISDAAIEDKHLLAGLYDAIRAEAVDMLRDDLEKETL